MLQPFDYPSVLPTELVVVSTFGDGGAFECFTRSDRVAMGWAWNLEGQIFGLIDANDDDALPALWHPILFGFVFMYGEVVSTAT